MEKGNTARWIVLYCLIGVLLVVSAGGGLASLYAMRRAGALEESVAALKVERDGDDAREDNVMIAEQYEIVSTLSISDAYKNGDASALTDKQKETLDMASAILDEIITEDMTPYDKEYAVYDWMVRNLSEDNGLLVVIPTTQADCDNPYGVLKYHNAVCVGYATTFRMFMQMLDIPCMVVHNTEKYHSWDLVQLDGEWYHTDVYSGSSQEEFAYFNMSDRQLAANGQSWDTDFFPAADALTYNYLYRNRIELDSVYDLAGEAAKLVGSDKNTSAAYVIKGLDEHSAQIAANLLERISEKMEYGEIANGWLYYEFMPVGSEEFLLSVTFCCYYDDGEADGDELDEEEKTAVAAALDEAFPDYDWEMDFAEDEWDEEPRG